MPRKPGYRARNYDLAPETGEANKHRNPYSPWQLIIEEQRTKLGISIRRLGELAEIPAGTLFNWVRAARGGPLRDFYTPEVNKRLAKAIEVSPTRLEEAFNQTMTLASPAHRPANSRSAPAPRASKEPSRPKPAPRPAPQESFAEDPSEYRAKPSARLLRTLEASGKPSFSIGDTQTIATFIGCSAHPPFKRLIETLVATRKQTFTLAELQTIAALTGFTED